MTTQLRHALRTIARMPVVSAVVVVSLAIGIGVNTVVFSWIEARLLKPLPGVRDGASFQLIEARTDAGLYPGTSWLEYGDLREQLKSFDSIIAFRMAPLYVGNSGEVERVFGLLVSDNYFSQLGLRPVVGRFIGRAEVSRPGAEPVAVISYGLWKTRFAGSMDALQKTLRVNGRELSVIGVAPPEFQGTSFGLNFDVWLPATLAPAIANGSRELEERGARGYSLMGRLQPDVTRQQAQSELDTAMRQLALSYPASNENVRGEVLHFTQAPRGPQRMLNAALAILQALTLIILVAVCGNVTTLLLARASARQREMGVRLALGAGRTRIAAILLTENLLLAIAGGLLGAAMAVWGTQALLVLPLTSFPVRFQTSIDGLALMFALTLAVFSGLAFGTAPALYLARLDPQFAVRTGTQNAGRSRMRGALMGVQVALALVVLVAAGMFFRSVLETREADPGFERRGVLLAAYDLSGRASDRAFSRALAQRIRDRLREIPGVDQVAIAASVPLDIHGLPSRVFTLDGHARADGLFDEALANTVTPGYFSVMRIPIRSGRDFAELSDTSAPPQVIVNEEFVRRFADGGEVLGRGLEARGGRYIIAGVVADSLYNAFGEESTPALYFSYRDMPQPRGEIHLRTRSTPETAASAAVRRVMRELDPDLPVFNLRSLTDHVETNLLFRRVPARMFVVLGPLLLLLAAIGIYAVVSYAVSLRTTEIGLRLALGATARRIVLHFVAEHLRIAGAGAAIGWLLAFVAALNLAPERVDLRVFVGAPAILLSVAALACWIPARRATRVDPSSALRAE